MMMDVLVSFYGSKRQQNIFFGLSRTISPKKFLSFCNVPESTTICSLSLNQAICYILFVAFNLSRQNHCSRTLTIELAALAPEIATAGIPIPGNIPWNSNGQAK